MSEIPAGKAKFRANEVCSIADIQPYVLRFWEGEFPQLANRRTGGRAAYSRSDVELVLRIKRLLEAEECSISEARDRLDAGDAHETPDSSEEREGVSPGPLFDAPPPERSPDVLPVDVPDRSTPDDRSDEWRQRYESARAEVDRLRAALDGSRAMADELDAVRRQASALSSRVAELEASPETKQLAEELRDVRRSLTATEKERNAATKRADAEHAERSRVEAELDSAREEVANLRAAAEAARTERDDARERVAALEARVAELRERLQRDSGQRARLASRLERVLERLSPFVPDARATHPAKGSTDEVS